MKNSYDVGILIFDFDGTILKSDKAVFIVMKKMLSDMGIKKSLTIQDVRENLGKPAEDFFKSILGPNHSSRWKKAFEKYDQMILKFATAFPGAVKGLAALKKRGYKLTLCSNCGLKYLEISLSKLNIKKYFDYTECNGENNLSKSKIVRKIIKMFSGLELKAAVIGDRSQDVAVAKENNSLSVGALYGYGKNELKEADITINKFSELLKIFK